LSLPEAERPRFATLYFDVVDTAGHRGGPDSEQLANALREVDAALAKLDAGLKARNIEADIVVVSDHGMAQMSPDRVILLDDIAPREALEVTVSGPYAALATIGPDAETAEQKLLAPHPHMSCKRKADLPASYDYGRHRRIPPIVCQAQEGWAIATRDKLNPAYLTGGAHGFDPDLASMAALFLATGPSFRPSARLPVIDNVDVYPLLARLLGVEPEANQGDPSATAAALR
jgi:predicted AlkP superfamily pyrophosphatase or phosphodiesterase